MVDLLGLPWMRLDVTKKEQFIEKWSNVVKMKVTEENKKQKEDAKKEDSDDEKAMNVDFSVK